MYNPKRALEIVKHLYSLKNRNIIPVTENILFMNGKAIVTNLRLRAIFDTQIKTNFMVYHKELLDAFSNISKTQTFHIVHHDNKVEIVSGSRKFGIATEDIGNFPAPLEDLFEEMGILSAEDIKSIKILSS